LEKEIQERALKYFDHEKIRNAIKDTGQKIN
jgi:hypothetical protein